MRSTGNARKDVITIVFLCKANEHKKIRLSPQRQNPHFTYVDAKWYVRDAGLIDVVSHSIHFCMCVIYYFHFFNALFLVFDYLPITWKVLYSSKKHSEWVIGRDQVRENNERWDCQIFTTNITKALIDIVFWIWTSENHIKI